MKNYYMAIFTKNCKVLTQTIMHGTREDCKTRASETSGKYGWGNKVFTAERGTGFDNFILTFTKRK